MSKKEFFNCGDFFYKVLDNCTAEITGYRGKIKKLLIPKTLDGYTVSVIGSRAFQMRDSLVHVTVPDSVTAIGKRAFYRCLNLLHVTIQGVLQEIGTEAFEGCEHAKFEVTQTGEGAPNAESNSEHILVRWLTGERLSDPLSLEKEASQGLITGFGPGVVDWSDRNGKQLPPETGQIRRVRMELPYYDTIASSFKAAYSHRDQRSVWSISDFLIMAECRFLEALSISHDWVDIVVRVLKVTKMVDSMYSMESTSLEPTNAIKHDCYYGTLKRMWDDHGWRLEKTNENGDLGETEYIYTDEQGLDHRLAICSWDLNDNCCRFVNHVIGSHWTAKAKRKGALMEDAVSTSDGSFRYRGAWSALTLLDCRPDAMSLRLDKRLLDSLQVRKGDIYDRVGVLIWDDAFHSECLKEVLLPENIHSIGENAFSGCPNLEYIVFPDNCIVDPTSIAPNAFDGCSEKLTFSVPERERDLINWIKHHGFRLETGAEDQVGITKSSGEDDDTHSENLADGVQKLNRLHSVGNPGDENDAFYELDIYRTGWSKLERLNRNKKQGR